jgi:MFS-type transporter involved in bile tolerance (Atg22 family)
MPSVGNIDPLIGQENVTSMVACVITAIWVAVFTPMSWLKMGKRIAGTQFPGSVLTRTYSSLKSAWVEAPRDAKMFLLYHMFAAQGLNAIIEVCGTYFTEQTKLPGMQVGIVTVLVLIVATGVSFAYVPLAKRFSQKTILLALHVYSFAITVLTPLIVNREGQFVPAIIAACMFGIAMGIYFPCELASFTLFIPHGREATFISLYNFMGFLIRWLPTLVYGAILQVTGQQTWAFMSIAFWFIMAFILLIPVKFEVAVTKIAAVRPSEYKCENGKRRQSGLSFVGRAAGNANAVDGIEDPENPSGSNIVAIPRDDPERQSDI